MPSGRTTKHSQRNSRFSMRTALAIIFSIVLQSTGAEAFLPPHPTSLLAKRRQKKAVTVGHPSVALSPRAQNLRPAGLVPPLRIGTGLTFDDGDQILVSAQKPLGIVLEEEGGGAVGGCFVAEIADPDSALARAGVRVGDRLVAVQNADVGGSPIEEVLGRIGAAPRVVNLRFQRGGTG